MARHALKSLAISALLLAACGNSTPAGTDATVGGDTITKPDGPAPDAAPSGPWTFSPAKPQGGQAASVVVAVASIDGDKAALELRVTGVAQLQGVAFRLTYDAARVTVTGTERGSAWGAQQVVDRFKARDEGELWGGVGYIGPRGLSASAATVVARVTLALSGSKPIAVAFRPAHNVLLSPQLRSLPAEWLGGTFTRK